MTPRERVGQLFVVPFDGREVEDEPVAELIRDYHVGGVVLDPDRDNVTNGPNTPGQLARLVNDLQRQAFSASPQLPLVVALARSNDGFPTQHLRGGMTAWPSQMAVGATWDTEQSEQVGEIVGRELAAVGINLLLGPSLDVLAVPQPGSPGDLGVRSFGGSPQWVGRHGTRFVEGVHTGGRGRVAVSPGSFPGIGGADRSAEEEVAVVEKTYQQLAATELVPFGAVTSNDRPGGQADALTTSHVRYRGIQQQLDRPLSLDSGGIRYVMSQVPSLAEWRSTGGVLVSPGLGLPAVRRYDDPELEAFNHRRVVREGLAAGHDLMVLTGFYGASFGSADVNNPTAEGAADAAQAEVAVIRDTIDWLTGVYQSDEAVRDAVDDAVIRVLELKQSIYPDLSPTHVMVDPLEASAATGLGNDQVLGIAREALTRITTAGTTAPTAPGSPQVGDRLLFVADARPSRLCRSCEPTLSVDPDSLVAVARRAYGRAGAHRIEDEDVAGITFAELKGWLQATGAVASEDTVALVPDLSPDQLARVDRLVTSADWIVFGMRELRPAEAPGSDALKLFLKTTRTENTDQRLVAVAFTAPYYLDTTEIAKLTAYYAAYASTEPFLEVAVRAIFGDEPAPGDSPVSVPGAGYDLFRSLEPADQEVTLELVGHAEDAVIDAGATFTVRTSSIRDANGHTVPDNTAVTFRRFSRSDGLFLPDIEVSTEEGRATAAMRAERSGELEISAVFANGVRSEPMIVPVEGQPGEPTSVPDGELQAAAPVMDRPPVDWAVLVLSLTMMVLAGVVGYGADPRLGADPTRMMRTLLLSLSWGLGGYLLVASGGLQLDTLGADALWPDGWNTAYQAPVFSFVLALLPALPTVVAGYRARRPTEGGEGG